MDQVPDKITAEDAAVAVRGAGSGARYEARVARRRPTVDDVKAQLDSKSADITARISSIQDNVLGGGQEVKKMLSDSPVVPMAGSLVGGLLVGLVFGGSQRRSSEPVISNPEAGRASKTRRASGLATAIGGLLINLAVQKAISYVTNRVSDGLSEDDATS